MDAPGVGTAPMPQEHGAWVVLYAPLLIGIALARPWRPAAQICLFLAVTGAFLARGPSVQLLKRRDTARSTFWLGVYGAMLLAGALPLLLVWRRWELLTIGGLAAIVFGAHALLQVLPARRRLDRSQPGEILSVLGLTLTAPAAFVAANGTLDGYGVCLWIICALYYAGGILNVKMNLTAVRLKRPLTAADRLRVGAPNLVYHALLGVMTLAFLFMDPARGSIFLVLAYAPAIARATVDTLRVSHRLPAMKKLGWREAILSVWFVGCTIGALLPPR
jgi:hypothetical protein